MVFAVVEGPEVFPAEREEVAMLQVDRYKGLLVKQRDIMTGLTGRLNERDEQILRLQEELEAYDSHQKCATLLFPILAPGCMPPCQVRQGRSVSLYPYTWHSLWVPL